MKVTFKYYSLLFAVFILCSCQKNQFPEKKNDMPTHEIEIYSTDGLIDEQELKDVEDRIIIEDNIEINSNEKIEERQEKVSIEDDKDGLQIVFDIIEIDGLKYGVSSVGGKVLEDGITVLLAIYNKSDDIAWVKSWNSIEVTELVYFSGISVSADELLVVVDRTLYAISIENGNINWETPNVGSVESAPIIDEKGEIYLISERKPYLTKLNNHGIVKWQLNSNELYGLYGLYFENDEIIVKLYDDERRELILDNVEDYLN